MITCKIHFDEGVQYLQQKHQSAMGTINLCTPNKSEAYEFPNEDEVRKRLRPNFSRVKYSIEKH